MNIKDYLKGKVNYPLTDANLDVILDDRGIALDADTATLSEQDKDLAYADVLYFMASIFGGSGATNKRGNWSETQSGLSIGITDRKMLITRADSIYAKYGENNRTYSLRDRTDRW